MSEECQSRQDKLLTQDTLCVITLGMNPRSARHRVHGYNQ